MERLTKVWLLVASLFLLSCESDDKKKTLTLQPSGGDDSVAILKALAEAKSLNSEGTQVTIDLGSGTYHLFADQLPTHELYISNHDHEPQRPVGLMIEGLENVTIKGDDAKLLFHGRVIPVVVKDSEHIKLEGFSIDYPRPALSQIEIIDIKEERVEVKVLEETKFRIEEGQHFVLEGEGFEQRLFVTMPFSANRRMKWGRADVYFNPQRIIDNGNHMLTLEGWSETPHLEVGDRYILRSYYRPTPGIVIIDSEDVTVSDACVHYAEGMALIAQHSTDVKLEGFSVVVPEGSDRYFTTQADATHFSGCRGHLISDSGEYEHMADDAINVHGTYLRVDSIVSPTELLVSFAHGQTFGISWFEAGDTLRVINRQTLLPVTGALVGGSVEILSPKELRVTLSEPLSDDALTLSLAVENLSGHPSVVFSNSVVRHNRARGALFSTPKPVKVVNNLFDHTHGSAILLCGDANGWYESGPCEDIEIRGNHFINALTSLYQFTNGVISIDPEIKELVEGKYYHGKVVIEGNTFEQFPTPLYYAESVRELVFRNNKIIKTDDFESLFNDNNSQVRNVGSVTEEVVSW